MSLNTPSPFGDGLNYRGVNSSLSIEGASLKVRYFLFGSPVSASAGSKPIYEIKTTEYKTNISAPMFLYQAKM